MDKTPTRLAIEKNLQFIESEQELLDSIKILKKRSENIISGHGKDIEDTIIKAFKAHVTSDSALEKFLNTKPDVPHEKYENHLLAMTQILTRLLQDDFGKSVPGSTEDFCFFATEGRDLWNAIHDDLEKILKESVGVTPFFDDIKSSSWVTIGFSVDAKWPPAQ